MKLDEVVKAFDKNVNGVSLVKEIVNYFKTVKLLILFKNDALCVETHLRVTYKKDIQQVYLLNSKP